MWSYGALKCCLFSQLTRFLVCSITILQLVWHAFCPRAWRAKVGRYLREIFFPLPIWTGLRICFFFVCLFAAHLHLLTWKLQHNMRPSKYVICPYSALMPKVSLLKLFAFVFVCLFGLSLNISVWKKSH